MKRPPLLLRLFAWLLKPRMGRPIDWHETVRQLTLAEGGKQSVSQAQMGEAFKLFLRWAYVELRHRPRQLVWFLWQHR